MDEPVTVERQHLMEVIWHASYRMQERCRDQILSQAEYEAYVAVCLAANDHVEPMLMKYARKMGWEDA